MQRHFHHGSYAERMLTPTENATRLGSMEEADAARWCTLGSLLVPYAGLLAANLQAGETILISGATGHFGSAAVAVALAMGAGCVIAPGRNEKVLEDLARRFGDRVRTVKLLGREEEDRERMRQAAPGLIDCVLDLLPPSADTVPVRAAAMAVRPYGRVVLMGGVGMLGGKGLELPYPWIMRNCITLRGQWLCPVDAPTRLVRLVRSGLLSLSHFDVTAFALDEVNKAVEHAAAHGGPFKLTVIRP